MLYSPDYHLESRAGDHSQVCPSFLEAEEGAGVRNLPSGHRQNRKSSKIRCVLVKQENHFGESGRVMTGLGWTRIIGCMQG